jgi:pyrroloquinoline quinone biosynthesis protein B
VSRLTAVVLGSAAGGGVPQWNCRCPVCELAWNRDPRVLWRTQSSIAVSADDHNWLLVNASPDLRDQIGCIPALAPKTGLRHSPIQSVFLTNADVDHVAGLLTLRERQDFTLYATQSTLDVLEANSIFNVLAKDCVSRQPIALEQSVSPLPDLTVRAFAVPGKVALYLENKSLAIGEATETTIGLDIRAHGKRIIYIPGCAAIDDKVRVEAEGADLLLYDGTTFTDDEMIRLGLSEKSAHRMGHTPITGASGSLTAFDNLNIMQRGLIHINNSNPILVHESPERREVEAAGWIVTHDGMVFSL